MIKTINITGSVSRRAGGLFESVRRLVQQLQLIPMDVSVLGTLDDFTNEDIQSWSPVEVHAFKTYLHQQFGYSRGLNQYLILNRSDIIHTHGIWTYSSVLTKRYCFREKVPYIISPHGMLDPWALRNSKWKKVVAHHLYESSHLRGASCLRALCDSEFVSFRKYGLTNPVCVIPNGIDLPDESILRADGPESSSLSSETSCSSTLILSKKKRLMEKSGAPRNVLFLGRIHPKKGIPETLHAWKIIKKKTNAKWRFIIAGWDQLDHQFELQQLCEELGLSWEIWDRNIQTMADSNYSTDVVFYGSVFGREKLDLLNSVDAFILASLSEGAPMSVLEAWAHGLPVLMTPQCNLPEGFKAGAALKIEANRSSIANGLCDLMSMSDHDLSVMGENGRRLVLDKFTWQKVATRMKEVYDWLLGGGDAPESVRGAR